MGGCQNYGPDCQVGKSAFKSGLASREPAGHMSKTVRAPESKTDTDPQIENLAKSLTRNQPVLFWKKPVAGFVVSLYSSPSEGRQVPQLPLLPSGRVFWLASKVSSSEGREAAFGRQQSLLSKWFCRDACEQKFVRIC